MYTRKYLEDLVKEGLVQDIIVMDRSYELLLTIGEQTPTLRNGSLSVYNELFGTIQYAFQTEALLAAARIYDIPSKKYPTRCLRGVLSFLKENTLALPEIREPYQLMLQLKNMNAPNELVSLASKSTIDFAISFSLYVDNLLKEDAKLKAIDKLKIFRDKILAHNENTNDKLYGPTWTELKMLIDIAKDVVGVLGWAFFSTAYIIEGEYILTNDSIRTSYILRKLFAQLTDN